MPNEQGSERAVQRITTLQDVGQRAGVSFQTVSKVLRGTGHVTEATRDRVLAAAEELGYVPNFLASGLARRSTDSVGFLTAGLGAFVMGPMLAGIDVEARQSGYSVVTKIIDPDVDDPVATLRQLHQLRVNGLICSAPIYFENQPFLDLLQGLPTVVTNAMPPANLVTVSEDSEEPGRLAANHLISLGHHQLATITGYQVLPDALKGRHKGFQNELKRQGITLVDIECGHWSIRGGYESMSAILDRQPDITAVFAQNDHMAMGALRAIHERGKRVPHDISVVGCDDVDFASFTWPPLTTIRFDFKAWGTAAVRRLLQLIEDGNQEPDFTLVPSTLIVRESSGPVNPNRD